MSALLIDVVAFTVPKSGHTPTENEDAHALDPAIGRFAIADGAAEGWASGAWAKALAIAANKNPPGPDTYADWLSELRAVFDPPPAPSAWYAEAKREAGAFSTLLVLSFESSAGIGWKWRAAAIGDSCLFQIRSGNLIARFPVESTAEFSNRPRLIGSSAAAGVPEPDWFAGRADPGDLFFLLTDALAEWFLQAADAGGEPWVEFAQGTAGSTPASTFATWVESQRDARTLRNDDTTALRITIGAGVQERRAG